jgi:hypothetical protein
MNCSVNSSASEALGILSFSINYELFIQFISERGAGDGVLFFNMNCSFNSSASEALGILSFMETHTNKKKTREKRETKITNKS